MEGARAKQIFSIYDNTFLGKGFSITIKYAFCSVFNVLSNKILINFLASDYNEKIKAQEKQFCFLFAHCAPLPRHDRRLNFLFYSSSSSIMFHIFTPRGISMLIVFCNFLRKISIQLHLKHFFYVYL